MALSYEELRKKTVEELREIAKGVEHQAVQGYTQMNKEHLLPALCTALSIDSRGHHEVVGIDKAAIKSRLHALRAARDEALAAKDSKQLKAVRRQMHNLKRRIRAATV
jgi:rubrerythrin